MINHDEHHERSMFIHLLMSKRMYGLFVQLCGVVGEMGWLTNQRTEANLMLCILHLTYKTATRAKNKK